MTDKQIDNHGKQKRSHVSQSEFPGNTLEQALRISQAIWDNFAGKGAAPHQMAMAIDMSPTSGPWRSLCGSSIAYGLTEGGYAANEIVLTDLGRRIVAPTEEKDDVAAKIKAITKPRILNAFFDKYDKAKLPKSEIAKNVLVSLGLPKDRADRAFDILKKNGDYTGVILETKTGPFIALDSPSPVPTPVDDGSELEDGNHTETQTTVTPVQTPLKSEAEPKAGDRVFITHGKNTKILGQVKEIVAYGKFKPVVAQEHETAAKPVPEKVMDDMRSCQAAVIHVGVESVLYDEEGNECPQINGNVLIEIGAAMALYGKNFILLVEEGVKLPSNLQGLYECRYQGDELNMAATMKLLKAFNEFK